MQARTIFHFSFYFSLYFSLCPNRLSSLFRQAKTSNVLLGIVHLIHLKVMKICQSCSVTLFMRISTVVFFSIKECWPPPRNYIVVRLDSKLYRAPNKSTISSNSSIQFPLHQINKDTKQFHFTSCMNLILSSKHLPFLFPYCPPYTRRYYPPPFFPTLATPSSHPEAHQISSMLTHCPFSLCETQEEVPQLCSELAMQKKMVICFPSFIA